MNKDLSSPIELDFKSASKGSSAKRVSLRTFDSYSFDKNILVPASAFRFTAPGVSISERTAIRSGDWVELFVVPPKGPKRQIATGILDETDTHITPNRVDYVLTGRDLLGQLVDNTAVDKDNNTVHMAKVSLTTLFEYLIQNTRIPQEYFDNQIPTGDILFQTQPGETKINCLQRYMEIANCLAWCDPDGRVNLGKPDFFQPRSGNLILKRSDPSKNNCIEARSKRNLNTAIRQIAYVLQTTESVPPTNTKNNHDKDMVRVANAGVGRSVFRTFSYGSGAEVFNKITQVGNSNAAPMNMGDAMAMRELARDNIKVLDVEIVVRGHTNENNLPYDVDQIYYTNLEDDNVKEDLYVYACRYDLSKEHGMMTTLRLCTIGAIVADAAAVRKPG